MKTLVLVLFLLEIPISGLAQQTINGSIEHDGMQREFTLYIPTSYTGTSPVPLVLNFHGYTGNANGQMFYGDFRPIADTAGFIIVHPQGSLFNGNTHWNVGGWTLGSTTDDVGFTAALIDSISSAFNIDPMRIYSTGMSNGGYMSFLLACQLSDRIAAIASVTGSMTPETFSQCRPQHPTPIMQIHSTSDPHVPYAGASWTKSIDDVLQYWIAYNNCNPTAQTANLPDIDPLDGSTVELRVYDGGEADVTANHFRVTGGGHTWPGSVFGGKGTNMDFNASVEIWNFFSRYDINGLIGTTGIQDPVVTEAVEFVLNQNYPNPFNPSTTISFSLPMQQEVSLILTDALGREVARLLDKEERGTGPHSVTFNGSTLPSGIYLYRLEAEGDVRVRRMLLLK